jgi:hypothetical protein
VNPPFWLYLYSTVFRPQLDLVRPDLLHVRISLSGLYYPYYHLFGNDNIVVLLSFVRRGLSLVVAQFLDKWIHCVLPIRLLCALLCYQAGDRGSCFYIPLHWVHFSYGIPFLSANRNHWIFCLLLVYPENLQRCQGRLKCFE